MVLTLLRHGPLAHRHQGRYNGWSDLPIDPTLWDGSAARALQERDFDGIFSSDLRRCTQTLELLGFGDYRSDRRLREVRFKLHIEGKSFDEISRLPDYDPSLLESPRRWHDFVCDESPESFRGRIESFLADLPGTGEILICSHAGTLREMLKILGQEERSLNYCEFTRIVL